MPTVAFICTSVPPGVTPNVILKDVLAHTKAIALLHLHVDGTASGTLRVSAAVQADLNAALQYLERRYPGNFHRGRARL